MLISNRYTVKLTYILETEIKQIWNIRDSEINFLVKEQESIHSRKLEESALGHTILSCTKHSSCISNSSIYTLDSTFASLQQMPPDVQLVDRESCALGRHTTGPIQKCIASILNILRQFHNLEYTELYYIEMKVCFLCTFWFFFIYFHCMLIALKFMVS